MVDESYPRMTRHRTHIVPKTDRDDARHSLGVAWRDRTDAENRMIDSVLALHAIDPEALNEAARFYDVPSREVNQILQRFRKIR